MLNDMANQPPEYHTGGYVAPGSTSDATGTSTQTLDYDYDMKSWPAFFSAMVDGRKKHDMRKKADRPYAVGDKVLLREYDPFGAGYTGRSAVFKITYITSDDTPCALSSNALSQDHCILSMELIPHIASSFTFLVGSADVEFPSIPALLKHTTGITKAMRAAARDGML